MRLTYHLTLLLILFASVFLYNCTSSTSGESLLLLRKPYLQTAFQDSVTVLWRTDKGNKCKVAYKTLAETQWKETEGTTRLTNTGVIENEVVLRPLQSASRYQYRIFTNDEELLSDDSLWFKSALADEDSSFTFFAVGDIGEPVDDGGTPDLLAKALAPSVDTLDFGLLLGDIIYPEGRSENYDTHLFQYFGEVFPYVPVYPLLGNHDWHEPENNYMQEWKLPNNEHYYSFNYGNVHFTGLDSKNGEFYQYEEQVDWLEDDLQSLPEHIDWVIVYLHHNGKSCTYKEDYENVVSLYPLFEKYDVDLVLNGHAHTYERLNPMNAEGEVIPNYIGQRDTYQQPEGFISITVGSGGKLRGIGSDPTPYTPDPEHCRHENLVAKAEHLWAYLQLSVNGNQLNGKAIATESRDVVDQFSIQK